MKSLLYFPFLFLAWSCSKPAPSDNRSQLVGMYKLYMMENQDSTGTWHQDPWMKDGTGYIVYDGLGHMAVQLTPAGYEDFAWILLEENTTNAGYVKNKIDSMLLPDLKAALTLFSSNYTYVANYTVNDTAHIVTHQRLSHSLPEFWNTSVQRKYTFSGDTLILQILNGNRRLKWLKQE